MIQYFIGIDLGTSAVKLLLVDEQGRIEREVTKEYPLSFPHPGWSEQNPEDWWKAVQHGVLQLTEHIDKSAVRGIGVGGQMHGLVALDEDDAVIRPAILWNDGRTGEEVAYLNETIGKEKLSALTANIAFAGFTAPKLLWMRRNEPENFARIRKIMLPKDYINYRLTGVHSCDYSDASGMLLLDVEHKCWSKEMLEICGVDESWMPKLFESYEPIGTIRGFVSGALGLPRDCVVVAGAGDNAAAAVGTGVVGEGGCKMGCMLSAASCNKWLCEEILHTTDYAAEQTDITDDKLGNNHVFFLPYLMGERSPINDTNARGTFTGITMDTTRADLVQAVLEGVAFAIRDSFEVARSLGIAIPRSFLCGGGAKSPLWRKIFSNVLGIPLDMVKTEQGPGYGGAMLAMVGCGVYPSVQAAADALVELASTTEPDSELTARYEAQYQKFKRIYPAMRELFAAIR